MVLVERQLKRKTKERYHDFRSFKDGKKVSIEYTHEQNQPFQGKTIRVAHDHSPEPFCANLGLAVDDPRPDCRDQNSKPGLSIAFCGLAQCDVHCHF